MASTLRAALAAAARHGSRLTAPFRPLGALLSAPVPLPVPLRSPTLLLARRLRPLPPPAAPPRNPGTGRPAHRDAGFEHRTGGERGGGGGGAPGGGGGGPTQPPLTLGEIMLAVVALGGMLLLSGEREGAGFKTLTWQEFYRKMLARGEVSKLVVDADGEHVHVFLHDDAVIEGYNDGDGALLVRLPSFRLSIASVRAFEEHMQSASEELGFDLDREIPIIYQRENTLADSLWSILPMAVLIGAWLFLTRRGGGGSARALGRGPPGAGGGGGGPGGIAKREFKPVHLEVTTTFKDVAGLAEAKQELKEFVAYLTKPESFKSLGAKPPRGALLVGPPGTGKTLLAKAVAGEAGVPFFSVSGSDFVEMFVGVGPSRVRDLFKEARKTKRCIVYIDEIDAVARERGGNARGGGSSNSERESTLNQLLVEMDGVASQIGDILVLASTNRVDILDKALLRPGRFDRHVSCDLPTLSERQDIFRVHMRKLQMAPAIKSAANLERLAQLTPGMSGADIAAVCNEAALHAARVRKTRIDAADFEHAVDRVLMGLERRSRVVSKDERHIVSVHEVGHALTSWFLKTADPVLKVSIIPRGEAGLGFTQSLPSTDLLQTQEALLDRMVVLLGGRAAEQIMFGRITTGAQDDLRKVTELAYALITRYGMSSSIGPLVYKIPSGTDDGKRKYSNHVAQAIDTEASHMIASAYERALALVKEHRASLETLSRRLVQAEMLSYEDLLTALGPRPTGAKGVTANWGDMLKEAAATAKVVTPEMGSSSSRSASGGGRRGKGGRGENTPRPATPPPA